jgi:hypothetical protein
MLARFALLGILIAFSCQPLHFLNLLLLRIIRIIYNNFDTASARTASDFSYQAIFLAHTVCMLKVTAVSYLHSGVNDSAVHVTCCEKIGDYKVDFLGAYYSILKKALTRVSGA